MGLNDEMGDERVSDSAAEGPAVTRRAFMIAGTGALAGAMLADVSGLLSAAPALAVPTGVPGLLDYVSLPGSSATLLLTRREDMVRIQLDLFNLSVSGNQLKVNNKIAPCYLVYTFGPQHVTEAVPPLEEDAEATSNQTSVAGKGGIAAPGNVAARLAGPSRIALELPRSKTGTHPPALSLSELLALPGSMSRPPVTKDSQGGELTIPKWLEPSPTQTLIEVPWHLVIAPDTGDFQTPGSFRYANGRGELWTARLQSEAGEGGTIRAPWTYDIQTGNFGVETVGPSSGRPPEVVPGTADSTNAQFPQIQAMQMQDRWNIAQLTNYDPTGGTPHQPANASRLWLSSRGASLDVDGSWDAPSNRNGSDLSVWQHRMTAGRDQHVKIVDNGYLYPFGHRATVTIVSDRQFQGYANTNEYNDKNQTFARLRQYAYITILEPTVTYTNGLDFPFTSISLVTDRTPLITPYSILAAPPTPGQVAKPAQPTSSETGGWVPLVNGVPFRFHMVGTDWKGRQIPFTSTAMFVLESGAVYLSSLYIDAFNAYDDQGPGPAIRQISFNQQTVAFATPNKPGDTDLSVASITLAGKPAATPQFVQPTLSSLAHLGLSGTDPEATVRLTVAEQMTGGGALPGNPKPSFYYHPTFVDNGFGASNPGRVFMKNAADTPGQLQFAAGSSGGLMTPNVSIDGLSRSLGPVADSDHIAAGNFDPKSYFDSTALSSAQFLGGINLSDIIAPVGTSGTLPGLGSFRRANEEPHDLDNAPNVAIPQLTPLPFDAADPTKVGAQVVWQPTINPDQPYISPANGASDVTVNLSATITSHVGSTAPPTFALSGVMNDFVFSLLGGDDSSAEFIQLTFSTLTFTSGTGQKTHVSPQISDVTFVGALSFLSALESLMSFGGDSSGADGVKIYVDGSGVHADVGVSLPPIGLGIFELSGIAFSAGLDLPLDGTSPAIFSFAFASQDDPFTIAGGIFGGGGFFLMAIGTKDVQLIQVSLDFGAMVALDLGIASGQVSLTAGIGFTYVTSPAEGCELQAWVKFDGSLQILGIITLSLEFDLVLAYYEQGSAKQLTGTATLYVAVGIFGFSKTVTLTAQKTFAQSGGSISSFAKSHALPSSAGDPAPRYEDQMSNDQWANNYCVAFA